MCQSKYADMYTHLNKSFRKNFCYNKKDNIKFHYTTHTLYTTLIKNSMTFLFKKLVKKIAVFDLDRLLYNSVLLICTMAKDYWISKHNNYNKLRRFILMKKIQKIIGFLLIVSLLVSVIPMGSAFAETTAATKVVTASGDEMTVNVAGDRVAFQGNETSFEDGRTAKRTINVYSDPEHQNKISTVTRFDFNNKLDYAGLIKNNWNRNGVVKYQTKAGNTIDAYTANGWEQKWVENGKLVFNVGGTGHGVWYANSDNEMFTLKPYTYYTVTMRYDATNATAAGLKYLAGVEASKLTTDENNAWLSADVTVPLENGEGNIVSFGFYTGTLEGVEPVLGFDATGWTATSDNPFTLSIDYMDITEGAPAYVEGAVYYTEDTIDIIYRGRTGEAVTYSNEVLYCDFSDYSSFDGLNGKNNKGDNCTLNGDGTMKNTTSAFDASNGNNLFMITNAEVGYNNGLEPSTKYRLYFDVKCSTTALTDFGIALAGSAWENSGSSLYRVYDISIGTEWINYYIDFDTPETLAYKGLAIRGYTERTAEVYFDNMHLVKRDADGSYNGKKAVNVSEETNVNKNIAVWTDFVSYGTNDWRLYGGNNAKVSGDKAQLTKATTNSTAWNGERAFFVTNNYTGYTGAASGDSVSSEPLYLEPSTEYRFYYTAQASAEANLKVRFYQADKNWTYLSSTSAELKLADPQKITTGWNKYYVDFTTPSTLHCGGMLFSAYTETADTADMYFGGFELIKKTTITINNEDGTLNKKISGFEGDAVDTGLTGIHHYELNGEAYDLSVFGDSDITVVAVTDKTATAETKISALGEITPASEAALNEIAALLDDCGTVSNINTYKAAVEAFNAFRPVVEEADLDTVYSAGLRFKTTVTQSDYKIVEYGTVMMPRQYMIDGARAQSLTANELTKDNSFAVTTSTKASLIGDTYYAVLDGVPADATNLSVAARSYVVYDIDGVEYTVYSTDSEDKSSKNAATADCVEEMAAAILDARYDGITVTYTEAITSAATSTDVTNGKFTVAQLRAFVEANIDAVKYVGSETKSNPVATSLAYNDYELVWNDEMDALNYDNWTPSNDTNWGMTEDGFGYTGLADPNVVNYSNGKLNITPKYNNANPVVASFCTSDNMNFKYGYMEIKAKIPFSRSATTSFWFKSDGMSATKDGTLLELDLIETLYTANSVQANVHYWWGDEGHAEIGDSNAETRRRTFTDANSLLNEYHVYGMEWCNISGKDYMICYVDGIQFASIEIKDHNNKPTDNPVYLIMGQHPLTDEILEKESSWLGDRTTATEEDWPIDLSIDYVRLYQSKSLEGTQLFTK